MPHSSESAGGGEVLWIDAIVLALITTTMLDYASYVVGKLPRAPNLFFYILRNNSTTIKRILRKANQRRSTFLYDKIADICTHDMYMSVSRSCLTNSGAWAK